MRQIYSLPTSNKLQCSVTVSSLYFILQYANKLQY